MTETKEAEDMKEFMTILMEVKVLQAEQNGKLDNLLDIKDKVDKIHDMASKTESRSLENEKDIVAMQQKMATKASKEHVERIVEEKDNSKRTLPVWVASITGVIALLLSALTFITLIL